MLGFPDTDPSPHSCYSLLDFPQFLFDLENGKIVTDKDKKFAIGGRRMLKDLSRNRKDLLSRYNKTPINVGH